MCQTLGGAAAWAAFERVSVNHSPTTAPQTGHEYQSTGNDSEVTTSTPSGLSPGTSTRHPHSEHLNDSLV